MVLETWFLSFSSAPFYKIMVPTVDTVRYNYLVSTLVANQNPVLLVGPVGTGKTSIAQSVLQSLPSSQWSVLVVNMSAQVREGRGSDHQLAPSHLLSPGTQVLSLPLISRGGGGEGGGASHRLCAFPPDHVKQCAEHH